MINIKEELTNEWVDELNEGDDKVAGPAKSLFHHALVGHRSGDFSALDHQDQGIIRDDGDKDQQEGAEAYAGQPKRIRHTNDARSNDGVDIVQGGGGQGGRGLGLLALLHGLRFGCRGGCCSIRGIWLPMLMKERPISILSLYQKRYQ